MADLRDAAVRAAVWSVIEAAAKAQKDEARAELKALEYGDTIAGRLNGQIIGKAYWTAGRDRLIVTDERALLAWLKTNYPTEIIETPNPAFLRQIEHVAKTVGGPIDAGGDVIPGLELVEGEPCITVRKDPAAEEIVAGLLAHGRIRLDGIRQLTPRLDSDSADSYVQEIGGAL